MKKLILTTLIGVILAGPAVAEDTAKYSAEAKGIIKEFFKNLKGTLQAAMKEGGPTHAIENCQLKAPQITLGQSEKSGWRVARTSLKLRNPANTPDAWEMKVLNSFEQRKAAGEDPMKIAYKEITEVDGKRSFRFMKAIPTAKLCLNCHGSNLKPEVTKTLTERYPNDQATGFKEGDIRGAFTLTKTL